MCCLITSPGRKHRPTLQTLREVERANADGGGLAWLDGKTVRFAKGLRADEIHERLDAIGGPALIHFRIATVGGVRPELCHPFVVSPESPLSLEGTADRVLAHNGHWPAWQACQAEHQFELAGPVSDSRVAAAAVAVFGASFLSDLPGRYALLDARGICRFGDWSRADGLRRRERLTELRRQ